MWVLIGLVGSSLVVSQHDTREACEGRAVVLREQKVQAKCVEFPKGMTSGTASYITTVPLGCFDAGGRARTC